MSPALVAVLVVGKVGVKSTQSAQSPNDQSLRFPEVNEHLDQYLQPGHRIGSHEGLGKPADATSGGEVVGHSSYQAWLGSELVIDRHAGHIRQLGHGVDGESVPARAAEQR